MQIQDQQQQLQNKLNRLPTDTEEFWQWFELYKQNMNSTTNPASLANLLCESIQSAQLDTQTLRNLEQPVHLAIPDEVKENFLTIINNNFPKTKYLLLILRSYIKSEKLRIIHLQQQIIETWRKQSNVRQQLAEIYSWFFDFLFQEAPEITKGIVEWILLNSFWMLETITLEESIASNILLSVNHETNPNVFLWSFAQATLNSQKKAFELYHKQLYLNNTELFLRILILLLSKTQITSDFVIKALGELLLNNSSIYDNRLYQAIELIVKRSANYQSFFQSKILEVNQLRKQLSKYCINFIAHNLMLLPFRAHIQEYLFLACTALVKEIFEAPQKQVRIYCYALISLVQQSVIQQPLVVTIFKEVFRAIQMRRMTQITIYGMAVLQTILLSDIVRTFQIMDTIGVRTRFIEFLSSKFYSTCLLQGSSEIQRLFVLTSVSIIKIDPNNKICPLLWDNILEQLGILRKGCDQQSFNVVEVSKSSLLKVEDLDKIFKNQSIQTPQKVDFSNWSLQYSRFLNNIDEFSEVKKVFSLLKANYPQVVLPYKRQTRIFHETRSSVRLFLDFRAAQRK